MAEAGWVRVDAGAAQRHPLFGFGGWLRLPSALMVLGIAGAVAIAWNEWAVPGAAGSADGAAAIASNATVVTLAGLQLAMAILWFRRWPHFRRFYWGYAALTSLALPALALALGDGTGGGGEEGDVVGDTLINLAFHAAFLAYLERSRRFRVTFESRVKPSEATPPPASHWPAPPPAPSN